MYEEIFTKKPFLIEYDEFQLEIKVEQPSRKHSIRCNFHQKGTHVDAFNTMYRFLTRCNGFMMSGPEILRVVMFRVFKLIIIMTLLVTAIYQGLSREFLISSNI